MKHKQIAYIILIIGIIYWIYTQDVLEILKTKLMAIIALFALGAAYIINKYIK